VSEATPHRRRPRRGAVSRPSPAAFGVVRVDPDFKAEFPDGDSSSTETHASLARAGQALLHELDRAIQASFGVPQAAATALAVVDGAGEPLTPSEIGQRVLVASATITSTLDLLERRGWVERRPNPEDRRSVLVAITPEGRGVVDRLLPGIRAIEMRTMSALTKAERRQLLTLLDKVLIRAAEVAAEPVRPLDGRRNRPARLDYE
jgi:DNA-binding MarR family transcriptional regulator